MKSGMSTSTESSDVMLELKKSVAESIADHCWFSLCFMICFIILIILLRYTTRLLESNIGFVVILPASLVFLALILGLWVYTYVIDWIKEGREDRVVEWCRWKVFRFILMIYRRDSIKNLLERLYSKEDSAV